jgi:hypothetical protein
MSSRSGSKGGGIVQDIGSLAVPLGLVLSANGLDKLRKRGALGMSKSKRASSPSRARRSSSPLRRRATLGGGGGSLDDAEAERCRASGMLDPGQYGWVRKSPSSKPKSASKKPSSKAAAAAAAAAPAPAPAVEPAPRPRSASRHSRKAEGGLAEGGPAGAAAEPPFMREAHHGGSAAQQGGAAAAAAAQHAVVEAQFRHLARDLRKFFRGPFLGSVAPSRLHKPHHSATRSSLHNPHHTTKTATKTKTKRG